MNRVILFGNSTTASVAYAYLKHDSPYEVVAFTVDRSDIRDTCLFGLPVVPFEDLEHAYPPAEFSMHIAISYTKWNELRAEKYGLAKAKGYRLITYVSSKATTWPGFRIGDNGFVHENAVIQPYATVGDNVTIGCGSQVGHHTTIGDHCFLSAQAAVAGTVVVEPYCFLGMNATVRDKITIARGSVIGAGAVILRSTRAGGVYMGGSAKRMPESLVSATVRQA